MAIKKRILKNFRVSEEFNRDLKEFSTKLDMSESDVLRKAFYHYRDSLEQPLKVSITPRHRNVPSKD